jgi:hypothetical protein
MTVDVKTVRGRRTLTFRSLDEVLADAEQLAASPHTKTLGNWSLGQLLMHLAGTMNDSIDGIRFQGPLFFRLIGPWIKGFIWKRGLPLGFRVPKDLEPGAFPAPSSLPDALDKMRTATQRLKQERAAARHPVLGPLTHDEWILLHLRHAEMHLSFAVPGSVVEQPA